jgi:hypothetical protein
MECGAKLWPSQRGSRMRDDKRHNERQIRADDEND